ncbi:hypothetical protein GSI_13384 [Ganoderma sinense ZZ0214-1]|uniref:Uncharacterized protein n=1 Tax=Ganoderma sinense ZZ0214-1 TaxID=1077348 RepID=A0A2G8RVI3_9APHY|nr:hypothetical protein GSI_13384 [Ganoderma sinense ZZ0214-1]
MNEGRLEVPHEVEFYQLPEGTEIQVRPTPLACSYKKLDGRWVPTESDLAAYQPLVGDDFPLGSIAIDPDGIGYVKGFASCPQHWAGPSLGTAQCLCMRSICWLRVGRVSHSAVQGPLSQGSNVSGYQSSASGQNVVLDAVVPRQDFRSRFSDPGLGLPNPLPGESHPQGPYLATDNSYDYSTGDSNRNPSYNETPGVEEPSLITQGFSEDVHQVFNDLQLSGDPAIEQSHSSDALGDNLQDIRAMLVPDGFTIHFNVEGGGIPLGDIDKLDNELPAFDHNASLGMKASIRFKFRYWQNNPEAKRHVDRRQQVKVRHGRKEGAPISLRAMAERVRSELVAEMHAIHHTATPMPYVLLDTPMFRNTSKLIL